MKRRTLFFIAEVVLIAVVAFFMLWIGIYHLTHKGLWSGVTEISLFGILAIIALLAALVYRRS